MTDFLCVKTCGAFRQGRTYSFVKPTAQALTAARGGFLKPLNTGGVVTVAPAAIQSSPKKRGRPRKEKPVATRLIGGLADVVEAVVDEVV